MGACFTLNGYPKLEPERMDDSHDGGEFRVSFSGQRLVKTLPAKSSSVRDFRHAFGARNITQGGCHQTRIVIFERGFQIMSDILVSF